MPEKNTQSGGISPALLITGAAGLGLIIFGLMKLGGPKAAKINAKFAFDHQGPAEDVDLIVRFGTVAGALGIFHENSDLVKVSPPLHVPAHQTPTPVELNVVITIPQKENSMLFPLPFTYDAEARIVDATSGEKLANNVKTGVFTEDANFGVTML